MRRSRGENTALGATLGGGSGLFYGALIGALIRTDLWKEVPLDRLRLGFTPQRHGGLALSASFAF